MKAIVNVFLKEGVLDSQGKAVIGAVIVVRRALVPSLLAELAASDALVIDVEELGGRSVNAIVDALKMSSQMAAPG